MQNLFTELNTQIKNSKNILLVTHTSHDGDALGSLAAMIDFLENNKKNYHAVLHEEISESFNFLPYLEKIKIKGHFNLLEFDFLIALDVPDLSRANIDEYFYIPSKPKTAIIDHHPTSMETSDLHLSKPKASSTAEILFDFFKFINYDFDKYTANALLTGIACDTENFSNPATNHNAVKQAGELLKRGANLNLITKKIFGTKKFVSLKLLGILLSRLKYNARFNLLSTVLTQKDLLDTGALENALDGVSNFLKNSKESEITLLLKETSNGKIKGSMRSNSINIEPLARMLGGGGHARAAGFVMEGRLEQDENGRWLVK